MHKMKLSKAVIALAIVPLFLLGCSDAFDQGDAERTFDGDRQVEFKPLSTEVSAGEDGTVGLDVQLISQEEERLDDIEVSFSTDGSAEEGEHYEVTTSSPVTISQGSWSTEVTFDLLDLPDDISGVELIVTIDDAEGAEQEVRPAPNLNESTISISP